jgi:hypothetical protein
MTTQEQIINTFKGLPKSLRSSTLRKLMRVFEEDLTDEMLNEADGRELTVEERLAIVESLAGSVKMESPPVTKEEEREIFYSHLAEKHK